MKKLVGPFKQLLTLRGLNLKGALSDDQLEIIENGGLLIEGDKIIEVGGFDSFKGDYEREDVSPQMVALPAFVDCHTHMCWGGTRSEDYALKIAGATYQDILRRGGGIHETVRKTRESSSHELSSSLSDRIGQHLSEGVTTIEIKSGYGLNVETELKMLRVIKEASEQVKADIVSTCLAAHVCPPEFKENRDYLDFILQELLPKIHQEGLSERVDIFTEENAFSTEDSNYYLGNARKAGFQITVHADQFTTGGSQVALANEAHSADHLEFSGEAEIQLLANSNVVGVVLPGASIGLGMRFAPARKLLDQGACVAIASDWNPGSAPMGDLLTQAAILSAFQKISTAETFAGITFRAAKALGFSDRGILEPGKIADVAAFEASDYREILWHQGKLKPQSVWKNGELIFP